MPSSHQSVSLPRPLYILRSLILTVHFFLPFKKATASYRLLPHIVIHEPIPEADCIKFQSCFSPGVIEIVDNPRGGKTCQVKNPRNDSVSREVLRHPEFEGKVTLGRVRDHFICMSHASADVMCPWPSSLTEAPCIFVAIFFSVNVESTGVYTPQEIPLEACEVLLSKIRTLKAWFKMRTEEEL